MGKNQAHKQLQRARHSGPTEGGDGAIILDASIGVDVSYHTPEWHAARIQALQTERLSWEDWKKKAAEEKARQEALGEDEERLMREYRAQLDAQRAHRLAGGTNHAHSRPETEAGKKRKRKSKDKDKKTKGKKHKKSKSKKSKKSKKKHRGSSASTSSASSDTDSGTSQQLGKIKSSPVRLSEFLKD